jgi:hypothetical protein
METRHSLPLADLSGSHTASRRVGGMRHQVRLAGTFMIALTGAAALTLAMTTPSGRPAVADAPPAAHLTSAQVNALEHMNRVQAARLDQALGQALGKLGFRAGLASGSPDPSGITLDWSVGINLTHAWVTASYANLWPYKEAINKLGDWADDVDSACGALAGYEIYGEAADEVCDAMAGTIAWLASRVNFPDTGSHGVWDTFYWLPWGYSQSGYW